MKKLFIYIVFATAVSTQQSCKKDLNALPESSRVAESVITDGKTAEIALNGAYYNFANANPRKTSWQYHELPPACLAGYMGYAFGLLPEEENMNASLAFTDYWGESYRLLNTVNNALKGISSLADGDFAGDRKKEIIGELHFLRAYAHFKLFSYYGVWFDINSPLGVLLRDEASTKANISKARSTVKDSYDFILADLDDASANAASARPNYYATKWAAMVLKMRVLMSRGAAGDHAEIITLANTIIQTSPYQLEPNLVDIFHSKGLASNEVILGLKPQANQEQDYYSRSYQYWPFHSAGFVAKGALKDLLTGDPRQAWMIGSANPYSAYSPNTFFFTKYMIENGTPTTVSETYYAIRLSEVYLLRAEAIVRSGGSLATARTDVKNVMSHAGVIDFTAVDNAGTPEDLLLQIYYETVRNLVTEDGQEWMALLRLDFNTVKLLKPTITKKEQYIIPIPHSEFVYNPEIGDQNPGYDK
ncbi:MAG TPA: RagB/SusD family nutrient uptake outer membrane protein [Chitinophagaceae bacterium]|nr:RagB/SusD family nutrient uptake outer membrane protein [Chitinophagaceae bacterium]HQW45356.1 RagB/SusD family nutrient uptake outer membrane protein [Chitinophagaceae bacterium]HQZ75122.1 RagB/SusD family nutrient uptake outer membrane protein [Chitinophagaceae bacterium]